jgi:hypothetical protein
MKLAPRLGDTADLTVKAHKGELGSAATSGA